MSSKFFPKAPGEVKDYGFDWQRQPKPALLVGETITTSTWTVTPAGLTMNSNSHDTTTTIVWLSGGTDGTRYVAVNQVVTSLGHTYEDKLHIVVESNQTP